MLDIFIEKSDQGGILRLRGDFCLRHLGEVREAMLTLLGRSDELVINIDDVEDIDPAALQLMCSVHKKTLKEKKSLSVIGGNTRQLGDTIVRAGYVRHVGCALDVKKECLWFGGRYE